MSSNRIVIEHGILDEVGDHIILRGVVAPESLANLLIGSYQREEHPAKKLRRMAEALKAGEQFPDIELGMRGQKVDTKGSTFTLRNEVYIVDGQQRRNACLLAMADLGVKDPRLGAAIYFDTSEESEAERFRLLNFERTRVSPNVLLRNQRLHLEAVATLYNLSTTDGDFALRGRVSWGQRPRERDLTSALALLKTVGRLHAHLGPGRYVGVQQLATGVQQIMDRVGRNVLRENVRTFFAVVEAAWGIKTVMYRKGAAHLSSAFLFALAEMFSRHENFWDGDRLVVADIYQDRLHKFSVQDPTVRQLSSSGSQGLKSLLPLLTAHVDKVKRGSKLVERTDAKAPAEEAEEEDK